jgi:hypothetical protein
VAEAGIRDSGAEDGGGGLAEEERATTRGLSKK